MSAALNALGDVSRNDSLGTHPDLSLGSFTSGISGSPARPLRVPSSSTLPSSTALTTPSPPSNFPFSRKASAADGPLPTFRRMVSTNLSQLPEEADGAVLNTPDKEKRRWDTGGEHEPTTPKPGAARSKNGKPNQTGPKVPTLRDQEKQIDNLKKENFDLKLKLHFLEERLAQLAPDQVEQALKQNVNLKVEVQNQQREAKKMKKRQTDLEKALEVSSEQRNALERELRDLERRLSNSQSGSRMDARRDEDFRELELQNQELQADMEELRELMQEHMDEKDRLQDLLNQQPASRSANASFASDAGDRRQRKRIAELETALDEMQTEAEARLAEAQAREEDLADEVQALRDALELENRRREAEHLERSESRAMVDEEREARENAEHTMNAARDRLAAVQIELQQREDELAMKDREIEQLVEDHERILMETEEAWQNEVKEQTARADSLQDSLALREQECRDLEECLRDLQDKTELALTNIEQENEERDAELAAANLEIKELSERIVIHEEDVERLQANLDRAQAEYQDDRDRLQALNQGFKQKCSDLEHRLSELSAEFDEAVEKLREGHLLQEELTNRIEDLDLELRSEQDARTRAERALDEAASSHADAMRRERRALESKESALQSTLSDLARVEAALAQREVDLQAVQQALMAKEADARREGDEATSARFSLQLELDRLRRDVQRLEDDLSRARRDRDENEGGRRDRDAQLDRLHAENRDLATQLAAQTQARLNVTEKLDGTQSTLKSVEAEAEALRKKISELESRLGKEQRDLVNADKQYRDQLTERNTLLITIYQYMDKILGPDKLQKKGAAGETKPFTNFSVFHDLILGRLKVLSQIQLEFDKRVKETEARHADKIADLRKQLDNRWKTLDNLESKAKALQEMKQTWRRRMSAKDGEIDAIKQSNSDLAAQLSSTRKPGGADPMELRSLTARATNAERRLTIAQNQLAAAEERLATMNQKTTAADTKWEARVKEYEDRLKTAEEKYKRERQGSKESQTAYETQIKSLNRQKELAEKRNTQLQDILKQAKIDAPATAR